MPTVNHYLVEIALGRADPTSFEKFCQAFFAALTGTEFVPLGGHHDGGAEAFDEPGVFEAKAGNFWQASVEKTVRSKIRRTVKRIKDYGRDLKQLTYCSSVIVPNLDGEEDFLSDELGARIRIRDQKYILSHINHSDQTVEAFNSFLVPHLAFLKEIGGNTIISHSKDLPARALVVFLGQEIDRRRGNTELLEAVTDSLILWALEGTDPDKKIFRTRQELLARIVTALPAANQFIKGVLDSRLEALASKANTNGREIRWHRGDDHFCLPFETRKIVEQENTEDEVLLAPSPASYPTSSRGITSKDTRSNTKVLCRGAASQFELQVLIVVKPFVSASWAVSTRVGRNKTL